MNKIETILFSNKQAASRIICLLEKEFLNLKWDDCNGIDIYEYEGEENELDQLVFEEENDEEFYLDKSKKILDNIVFQVAIGLENTEYCREYDCCPRKIICPPVVKDNNRRWSLFRRETLKENIESLGEKNFYVIDEGWHIFYSSTLAPDQRKRYFKETILSKYQLDWRNVRRRKEIFAELKSNPELGICLGAEGLEYRSG